MVAETERLGERVYTFVLSAAVSLTAADFAVAIL
jgi:hypothetical protein